MEYCEYEGEEEESHDSTPILKARATATAGYTKTSRAIPFAETQAPPSQRHGKRQPHFLFPVGIGMCIFVILLMLWNMVLVPWWHGIQVQWHYGDNHVSLMGANVGHGGMSRFIAFSDENEIVVVEVVNKQYSVYIIPTGIVQNQLVTLSLRDVNGDGKPDLIVTV